MELSQLNAYRQVALDHLEVILRQLSPQPHAADYFIDTYIRTLSKLPERPENANPYEGLYGPGSTMDAYRDVAVDRLQELVVALPELAEVDEEVDRYIRLISELPERPGERQPYEGLFILRTPDPDPFDLDGDGVPDAPEYITSEQVLQILGTREFEDRAIALTPGINTTFDKYQINTKLRMAHFLAQVMHESGGFRWLREIWGPTAQQRRYDPVTSVSRSLGNTQPGDGERYMGRGLIQLTGRANYQSFSEMMGKDFIAEPELVEKPPYAVVAAGWYWDSRKINTAADRDDVVQVTRLINGGTNGLDDRKRYLKRAKLVLKV